MIKIALIGLGNLGRHYMSGLSKVKIKTKFFFIDSSTNNLNNAKKHWLNISKKKNYLLLVKNWMFCHKI